MSHTETVTWVACTERLPDADAQVLFYETLDECVHEGWLDCDDHTGFPQWRDVTGLPTFGVTHWAEMPFGPGVEE